MADAPRTDRESRTTANVPFLRIDGVTRAFGDFVAVREVSLDVAEGEFFSLLGGSGCGKSTLLRMLAGLERPDAGRILIEGRDITHLPPYRRPVNMMFQSYALFPHLNVFNNVAFGLRQERHTRSEIRRRVGEALALVELGDFARRRPDQLSGGQRQRVALARALVKAPRLLLLDEPLAALDRRLRERTQQELARIQRQVGITFILVTHDQEEAMNLSSRIAVMREGVFEQVGTPREIYERPANAFVAGFVGSVNLVRCRATDDRLRLSCAELGATLHTVEPGTADECWVAIRPERIRLTTAAPSQGREPAPAAGPGGTPANRVHGTLESVAYLGAQSVCRVRTTGGALVLVHVPMTAAADAPVPVPGTAVCLEWTADCQRVLPA